MTPSGTTVVLLLFFIFLVFPYFILLFVLVAIKFARFLQISPSSLLNNHINLFLSDNSGEKKIVIYIRKESISSKGIFITFN
jgi:hypothetical protein